MAEKIAKHQEEYTLDGSWNAGILLLVNQGLATLAFFGVGVNLVLFLTRVMNQDNASAANNVSKWTGTVYLFSLLGAFLSDSYWGRYKTCAIFQVIFGLASLSLSSYFFLLKPTGCGDEKTACGPQSTLHVSLFYVSIYLIALGNGGYQPTIATFGSDQFDEEHPVESRSKVAFFSYFYLALNLGSLFSNTFLGYYEDKGIWALGFWASTGSATLAIILFLLGTPIYRHFTPKGNPFSRFCQVLIAASRKSMISLPSNHDHLYELRGTDLADNGARKILHTNGFTAAVVTEKDETEEAKSDSESSSRNPWRDASRRSEMHTPTPPNLAMHNPLLRRVHPNDLPLRGTGCRHENHRGRLPHPPSQHVQLRHPQRGLVHIYRRAIDPAVARLRKSAPLTELERMGVGLLIAVAAMLSAGGVERLRLRHALAECPTCPGSSDLSIFWQVPQYVLIGASEVFMYVGQLEFFNAQAPDGLKSFGSALSMTSISLGNYVSSLIVTIVMKVSTADDMPGWIPKNLNDGRLDMFYYLLAALTAADFVVYVVCARWYKYTRFEERSGGGSDEHLMV
ncbi:hypothetical protein SASPL_145708 [Salvia splendens]|uniref:Solute carrier family 15 (Peptide/histidine transporter), member 3/4 n=1 Tax=Salvia splendens TaxID=180675 RepID=A0A8X8WJL0_SALSN|nr:hypothetical protein SASPL_145708 [Salvia splendens]